MKFTWFTICIRILKIFIKDEFNKIIDKNIIKYLIKYK